MVGVGTFQEVGGGGRHIAEGSGQHGEGGVVLR